MSNLIDAALDYGKRGIIEVISQRDSQLLAKLDSVIQHAREYRDGHFYLLSFTTGYKGGYGTLDLDTGDGRGDVWKLPAFGSIEELVDHMLSPSCGHIRLTGGHT